MKRVLFVSNGHGEAAIADCIAAELRAVMPDAALDHLALVGEPISDSMREVGPRRTMPSGGLVAMGNVGNLLRDLRAGLLPLVASQRRFLRRVRGSYDVAVAVGDVYALAMTLHARSSTVFVGTAKSVSVARYGALEERILARAKACFVRDEATAQALRRHGLSVEPSANVIVDLFAPDDDPAVEAATTGFATMLALFPGSRASAYDDAAFLLQVLREIAGSRPDVGAVLSIARGLDAGRFAADAQRAGWQVSRESVDCVPFSLCLHGRTVVRAWTGSPASLLEGAALVLGQAGTANEGAAAAGVPVVAFARDRGTKARWYRRRQQGLLGDALAVIAGSAVEAARGVSDILNDPARRRQMSETGRARLGAGGGARRIADRIASLTRQS
ncbi:MAG: hypothetical protein WA304_02215 [Candidatus Cybelea sp.]